MKHFYFFRHGQTNENRDGKQYSTGDNAYLTETGVKQAQELAKYLSDKNLDIIYSSPFNRTIETAKIIAKKYKNLHIETNNALKERAFGFWHPETKEAQNRLKETLSIVKIFLDKVTEQTEYKNIAISSHGGITRALCYLAGKEIGTIKNCDCFHFSLENGIWSFIDNFDTGIEVKNISDKPAY